MGGRAHYEVWTGSGLARPGLAEHFNEKEPALARGRELTDSGERSQVWRYTPRSPSGETGHCIFDSDNGMHELSDHSEALLNWWPMGYY